MRHASIRIAVALAVVSGALSTLVQPASAAPYVAIAATDPLVGGGSQHQSIVEPVTAAWGSTIVSTYQVGRFAASGSGAAATGWATSVDGGTTWTSGLVPSITTATNPAGIYPRTVNMTVAYDRKHAQFIITTIGMALVGSSYQETEMFMTRSSDGLNWSAPTSVVNTNRPDKDWTVCDNTTSSALYGRCYIVYSSDTLNFRFQTVHTDDGGASWSAPVGTPNNAVGYNVNPVVRPDGMLVVVATDTTDTNILAFRSTDGGATFNNPVTVAPMVHHDVVGGMRDRPKPSAAVDSTGRVYAAWYDCAFRAGCASNDVVWVKSDEPLTWSALQRVDVDPISSTVDHFIAGMGVKPGTSGPTAQLDLQFFQMPVANCTTATCAITAVTTESTDGGATWAPTTALHATPMLTGWMPLSSLGRMLTDYPTIAYRNGIPLTTLPIASVPVGGTINDFRQPLYYARLSQNNVAATAVLNANCVSLSCSVDASQSIDPDGSIVSYAWDFGDGATATGPIANHVYASAGYTIMLTLTDNLGATTIATTPASDRPVASFTQSCVQFQCTFDGSASADPDGSIAGYIWNFGDGTLGTGVSPAHTYPYSGQYNVTLTVADNVGLTGVSQHIVGVTGPNVLPTAAFTSACNALQCTVNAATSSDVDGTIVSYAWSFSDGSSATGAIVNHAFPIAGTWPATLTVTDDLGGVATVTQNVVTGIPTDPGPYATDGFGRTVSNGWGNADLGGAWSTSGTSANASVSGGAGRQAITALGSTLSSALPNIASTDTELRVRFATDRAPTGNGHWISYIVRRVNSINEYRVRVKFATNGIALSAIKLPNSSTSSFIGSEVVTPLAATANLQYQIRAQVLGVNPTLIRARVWLDGQPEPNTWTVSQTDATPTLQAAGSFALSSYVSGTTVPVNFSYDDIVLGSTNHFPIASFTKTCTALACSFNGGASSDPDGAVANYQWSFGDGTTATGVTTNHTYAAAGTYTTTLTVTDGSGAQVGAAQTFPVTVGGANLPPIASFATNCSVLVCQYDATASSDPDGTISSYAWTYSDGSTGAGVTSTHAFSIPGTWPVSLTVTDNQGAQASVTNASTTTLPPASLPLITDGFTRTIANGWGNADSGGAYTIAGNGFAVNGSVATQKLTSVNTAGFARLFGSPLPDADVQLRVAADQTPVGTGYWVNVVGRSVNAANEYRARIRFGATGVFVGAYRLVTGSSSALIGAEASTGLAMVPNQFYRVRMNVMGTNPTTIKIKVWVDGTAEPAGWNVSVTDASASLQTSGAVGITTWVQGTTPLPLTFSFDDLVVRVANQAPIAVIAANCLGLNCAASAAASSDPDGSVVAYNWSFGDGSTATGAVPSGGHTYAVAGSYIVTLTITDDKGAQTSIIQTVNVS